MGRKSQQDLIANAIMYTYPTGEVDILCSSDRIFIPKGWEEAEDYSRPGRSGPEPTKRAKGKKSEGDDLLRSMRRARSKLRRLALANGFDYFVTLTLDPAKIDRYDGAAVTKALSRWCDNMVRRHGLRYILVPEQHKDGAFHFHGFMAGEGLRVEDSGVEWDGRPVYNLPQWSLGFTTAQTLYGEYSAAVGYCCKYIGKQQGQRPLGRWYYSGGDLREPAKDYLIMDYREMAEEFKDEAVEFEIPGSKLLVIHTKTTTSCGQNQEETQDVASLQCSRGEAAQVENGKQPPGPDGADGYARGRPDIPDGSDGLC